MSIGKYLTSPGVIGAAIGALGTLKQTQEMPKDWRRYLPWVIWVAGLLLALASVSKQVEDEQYAAQLKEARKHEKLAAKAARKRG